LFARSHGFTTGSSLNPRQQKKEPPAALSFPTRQKKNRSEALVNGKWQVAGNGISIGHKRIQTIPDVVATELRLKITAAEQTPAIRKFAVYYF